MVVEENFGSVWFLGLEVLSFRIVFLVLCRYMKLVMCWCFLCVFSFLFVISTVVVRYGWVFVFEFG